MSKSRYLDHLRNVPLFAGCTKKQLEHVASITTELRLPPGATVMHEGSAAHEFVIIESGSASVSMAGRQVATLGAGDMVGELALVLNRPRSATVTAVDDLTIVVVDSRSFSRLLDEVPGLARRMLTTVAERLVENSQPTQLLH